MYPYDCRKEVYDVAHVKTTPNTSNQKLIDLLTLDYEPSYHGGNPLLFLHMFRIWSFNILRFELDLF